MSPTSYQAALPRDLSICILDSRLSLSSNYNKNRRYNVVMAAGTLQMLMQQIVTRCGAGESVALCTVVNSRGSTPQAAGARMLVLADGGTLGTLGGGCVEAEVRQRALQSLERRTSELLNFKLDHDYGWDDGLICGGTMDIFVQVLADAACAQP